MKNRKIIAFALSMGILSSCFGGIFVSYAKSELVKKETAKNEFTIKEVAPGSDDCMVQSLPPSQEMMDLKPEVYDQKEIPVQKIILDSNKGRRGLKSKQDPQKKVLYEATQSTLNSEGKEMFQIGKDEIEDMMQKGYSVKDIFKADEIGNKMGIEPEELLEKKVDSKTSLEDISENLLKQSKEKTIDILRNKYKKAYKKLEDKELKEDDIIKILTFVDMNGAEVSDALIDKYQKQGDKIFQEVIQSDRTVKQKNNQKEYTESKKRSQISAEGTNGMSKKLFMDKLELLSKKTGKPVNELLDSYNRNKKNQDTTKN